MSLYLLHLYAGISGSFFSVKQPLIFAAAKQTQGPNLNSIPFLYIGHLNLAAYIIQVFRSVNASAFCCINSSVSEVRTT